MQQSRCRGESSAGIRDNFDKRALKCLWGMMKWIFGPTPASSWSLLLQYQQRFKLRTGGDCSHQRQIWSNKLLGKVGEGALLEPGGFEKGFVHPLEAERALVFQGGRRWVEAVRGIQCAGDYHGNQRETPPGGKEPRTGEGEQKTCSERIKLLPAMPVLGGKQ